MKTSNILLSALLGLLLIIIAASVIVVKSDLKDYKPIQLTGNIISKGCQVTPFSKIDAAGGINVRFTQDSVYRVTVKADSSLVGLVETEVREGTLWVRITQPVNKNQSIEVNVVAPLVNDLNLSAGCKFATTGIIQLSTLDVDVNSGAMSNISINVNDLKIEASSGSIINFSGQCNDLNASCNSGSILEANGLTVQKAKVSASSGAILNVNVLGAIDVKGSMGSIITCKGNPQVNKIGLSSGAQFNK